MTNGDLCHRKLLKNRIPNYCGAEIYDLAGRDDLDSNFDLKRRNMLFCLCIIITRIMHTLY